MFTEIESYIINLPDFIFGDGGRLPITQFTLIQNHSGDSSLRESVTLGIYSGDSVPYIQKLLNQKLISVEADAKNSLLMVNYSISAANDKISIELNNFTLNRETVQVAFGSSNGKELLGFLVNKIMIVLEDLYIGQLLVVQSETGPDKPKHVELRVDINTMFGNPDISHWRKDNKIKIYRTEPNVIFSTWLDEKLLEDTENRRASRLEKESKISSLNFNKII